MKTVSLLHPFSAKAIGLKEIDLLESHSKPHVLALQAIEKKDDEFSFTIDYFTASFWLKKRTCNGVMKRFFLITFPFIKRHQWRNQFSAIHYLYYAFNTPDLTIINMSGHGSKYVFKLAALIKRKNKKYIAMIGGLHMSYEGKALAYYQNAHHIIVHTEYQKQQLLQNSDFAALDIRVLPLGVDTDFFKPKKIEGEHCCSLLYVGRLSRLKQVEKTIEAIGYLKNKGIRARLTIIGPVSDKEYFEELQQQVRTANSEKDITFLDAIPNEDLIAYYQKAQLLLLPSQHESFGMVMTEAMACGVPVVALKGAGGPDEIITHDQDGILVSKENYAEAVYQLLIDEEKLIVMKTNARTKVEQKFSLNKTIELLKDSIERALV